MNLWYPLAGWAGWLVELILVDVAFYRMLEEILDTRVMVKTCMKAHKNDKVSTSHLISLLRF